VPRLLLKSANVRIEKTSQSSSLMVTLSCLTNTSEKVFNPTRQNSLRMHQVNELRSLQIGESLMNGN